MDIKTLNIRVSKLNQKNQSQDVELFSNVITKALVRNASSKSIRDITPKKRSELLSYRLGDTDIPSDRMDYYKSLNQIKTQELKEALPDNHSLFFLNSLKTNSVKNIESLVERGLHYNLKPSDLEDLQRNGFLSWAETNDSKESLEAKKLLKRCDDADSVFLDAISGKNITIDSNEFRELVRNHGIEDERLEKLINERYISGLRAEDIILFDKGVISPSLDKKRIIPIPGGEINSLVLETLLPNEKDYLEKLHGQGLKSKPELLKIYSISDVRAYQLETILSEPGSIKYTKLDTEIKIKKEINRFVTVNYEESDIVLETRTQENTNSIKEITHTEINLVLKALSHAPLSKNEMTRLLELKFNKISITPNDLPSPKELVFLNNVNGRSFTSLEKVKEIGFGDFGVDPTRTHYLIQKGLISASIKEDGKIEIWSGFKPTKEVRDAYIWSASSKLDHPFLEKELGIPQPDTSILELLKDKESASIPSSLMDYNVFFKLLREEDLTGPEKRRLDILRMNGIHIEKDYSFLKEEPKSFRLKKARNDSLIKSFIRERKIDISVIDEVNTFKQVSEDYLLKRGLNRDQLTKLSSETTFMGVDVNGKILNKHILATPNGPLPYYSIAHSGIVSGRSILEQFRDKDEIAKSPQRRQDLLFHDLKVADCVFLVKCELESKGYKVNKILNESLQYSETKAGKLNHERSSGPAFMDAQLIIEVPESDPSYVPGGKNTKVVAVEYGNYSNERMVSKIQNSVFDEAFVFSNKTHTVKYSKVINSTRVQLRTI